MPVAGNRADAMIVFPPCKINLGLQILRKRPDGYHDLSTCFYPLPWTDILEVIESDQFAFDVSGLAVPGDTASNLSVRAYELMRKEFKLPPVRIYLHKIIPMGAGLGGGSADGAYTLRLLNEKFQLNASHEKLAEWAAQLGSDCAFFLHDRPMLGSGKGNVLTPFPFSLKGRFIVVVKPDVHVSTAEAYAGVRPAPAEKSLRDILGQPMESWRIELKNDFENSVFAHYPAIARIKERLYEAGAAYASMSGSGSAVFGIFSKPTDLRENFTEHTYWSSVLTV